MGDVLKQVSPEKMPKLLQTLENKLPESIVVYHWIKTQLEWAKDTPGLQVRIFSLNGDGNDASVICVGDGIVGCNKMYGVIYATAEKEESFKEAVKSSDSIEWKRIKRFLAVLERNIPMLEQILEHKGCKILADLHECYLHYMSVEKGAEFTLPDLPKNVRVGPLDERHLQTVCDNWSHYDLEYRPVVANDIKFGPAVGVFVKNDIATGGEEELASMVMRTEYGGIGVLQTVPAHRMKGYAKIAFAHIIKQLGQKGFMPFGTALTWNESSLRLFDKFGFDKLVVTVSFILIAVKD
ncbi:Hypothetical predicted protein [Cloeon dipterum]|uniref:GCN5-related N-acetyltransferase Rv2170-like domain-containing protein n=2 Tax=Cloeon dipterum TaxID=197152 RepID=A0A8S1DFD7_9INSE|nr:Hypothetical predicted protein [Cloeon dipterum]